MAPTQTLQANGLAAKLAAKEAEIDTKQKANKLALDLDYDGERLNWSCDIVTFLNLVKPSASGDSEGLMLSLAGKFDFKIDGKTYAFDMAHARGGGAWVIVRMTGRTA